jgi:hypothetical protein
VRWFEQAATFSAFPGVVDDALLQSPKSLWALLTTEERDTVVFRLQRLVGIKLKGEVLNLPATADCVADSTPRYVVVGHRSCRVYLCLSVSVCLCLSLSVSVSVSVC